MADIKVVVGVDLKPSVSDIKSKLEGYFKGSPIKVLIEPTNLGDFAKKINKTKIELSNISVSPTAIANITNQIANGVEINLPQIDTGGTSGSGRSGGSRGSSRRKGSKMTSMAQSYADVRFGNLSSRVSAYKSSVGKLIPNQVDPAELAEAEKLLNDIDAKISNIRSNKSKLSLSEFKNSISNAEKELENALSQMNQMKTIAEGLKIASGFEGLEKQSKSIGGKLEKLKIGATEEESLSLDRYSNAYADIQIKLKKLSAQRGKMTQEEFSKESEYLRSMLSAIDSAIDKMSVARKELKQTVTDVEASKIIDLKDLKSRSSKENSQISKLYKDANADELKQLAKISEAKRDLDIALTKFDKNKHTYSDTEYAKQYKDLESSLSKVISLEQQLAAAQKDRLKIGAEKEAPKVAKLASEYEKLKAVITSSSSDLEKLSKADDMSLALKNRTSILKHNDEDLKFQLQTLSEYKKLGEKSGDYTKYNEQFAKVTELANDAKVAVDGLADAYRKEQAVAAENKVPETAKRVNEYNSLKESIASINAELGKMSKADDMSDGLKGTVDTLKSESENLKYEMQLLSELEKRAKASGDYTKYNEQFAKVTESAKKARIEIEGVADAYKKEQQAQSQKDKTIQLDKERIALLNKVKTLQNDINKSGGWTTAQYSKNTRKDYKNIQSYKAEVARMAETLSRGPMGESRLNDIKDRFSEINENVDKSRIRIKNFGKDSKAVFSSLSGLAEKFVKWFGVSQVIMRLVQYAKDAVSAVIEIDTAMTELKKVTDETSASYDKFLTTAGDRAKTLGATVSDVVNATADFARLGYGVDEASQLADAALVYKNVGDGIEDISQASESVISTMQAFGVQANESMQIVDKFNEVGKNVA